MKNYTKVFLISIFSTMFAIVFLSFLIFAIFQERSRSNFIDINQNQQNSPISKFESRKYLCSGSCICNTLNNEQRRSTAKVAKTGISSLILAVSTAYAFKLAKDKFSQQCQDKLSLDNCPPESITSEVDGCLLHESKKNKKGRSDTGKKEDDEEDEVHYFEEEYDDEEDDVIEVEEVPPGAEKVIRTYNCQGNCVVNMEIVSEPVLYMEAKGFGCEEIKFKNQVSLMTATDPMSRINIKKAEVLYVEKGLNVICADYPKWYSLYYWKVKSARTDLIEGGRPQYCSGGAIGENDSVKCELARD